MSQAGARSERGDEYQLRVALRWLIRLWTDPTVVAVQTESLGMPGDGLPPLIDDIVVVHEDGRRLYVQAKKNHPDFGTCSVRDREMKVELVKARDQLERSDASRVRFVSRSPFGALHKLAEGARDYPDAETFAAAAPATLTKPLRKVATLWERPDRDAFWLVRRIDFTVTGDYDEMDRDALGALRMLFARPDEVWRLLRERLGSHQSRLRDPVAVYTRPELERELSDAGHVASPERSVADGLAAFRRSSGIGRAWVRTLGGEHIPRAETDEVLAAIEAGHRTVLVEGEPGMGKTCVMLDVADALEARGDVAVLFVKGDRFGGAADESALVERGLPDDIAGRCSRLSVHLPVVVILDALDVLSIQRMSGTLAVFLGLMDRLSRIENVTVVASCRPYDLRHDPLLRGRTWASRVTVRALSVERDVRPILERWGIDIGRLDEPLVELLRVPSRLWLYGEIRSGGPVERVGSVYELHDRYLESVRAEPEWGESAPAVLAQIAARMQASRRMEVPRAEVDAPLAVMHGLLSRGVLREAEGGLVFGHQEILDVVAVRAAQRRGESLLGFVASQPALPFIRPTVRVFMHVLRAESPARYRREVWAVLDDDATPYHLRRLVAETLAEVEPVPDDIVVVVRLLQTHPDLFERFLQRASGEGWLGVVVDELLPFAERSGEAEQWSARLHTGLSVWVERRPDVVLPAWRRMLEADRGVPDGVGWTIANALGRVLQEPSGGRVPDGDAEWLLREMLDRDELSGHASSALGPAVQAWVRTRGGDAVLVAFLLAEGALPQLGARVRSLRERGEPSEMPVAFLSERLTESDAFLEAVLGHVLTVVQDGAAGRWDGLLSSTSWRARHNDGLMSHDALHDVVAAVQAALSERARRNDLWWQNHHERLTRHALPGARYLALRVFQDHPAAHVDAIGAFLTDPETHAMGDLCSEVRELAHAVFPFLPDDVSEAYQALILAEAERAPEGAEAWYTESLRRGAYRQLQWVPRPYLTPEAQAFVETWGGEFGEERLGPDISHGAHYVASPVSGNELLGLSVEGVVRVAHIWCPPDGESGYGPSDWELVPRAMASAAMHAPEQGLAWLDGLLASGARAEYLNACVDGVARYVRIRDGTLSFNGVREVPESPLSAAEIGWALLSLCETHGETWMEERVASDAVLSCVRALTDAESAERITRVLARLGQSNDPGLDGPRWPDMESEANNATRAEAARTAVELASRLSEAAVSLPVELVQLLHALAGDERPSVRLSSLVHLAPLTHTAPDLGWALLNHATVQATRLHWIAAERVLYYAYRDTERVAPVLDRFCDEALDEAGEVYGRIGALRVVSGLLDEDAFFDVLERDQDAAQAGAAEVFAVNVRDARVGKRCEDALVRLLEMPGSGLRRSIRSRS